jgi:hypothetical protein
MLIVTVIRNTNVNILAEIWGFHMSEDVWCFMGCDTMCSNRHLSLFCGGLLSPSTEWIWRWEWYIGNDLQDHLSSQLKRLPSTNTWLSIIPTHLLQGVTWYMYSHICVYWLELRILHCHVTLEMVITNLTF